LTEAFEEGGDGGQSRLDFVEVGSDAVEFSSNPTLIIKRWNLKFESKQSLFGECGLIYPMFAEGLNFTELPFQPDHLLNECGVGNILFQSQPCEMIAKSVVPIDIEKCGFANQLSAIGGAYNHVTLMQSIFGSNETRGNATKQSQIKFSIRMNIVHPEMVITFDYIFVSTSKTRLNIFNNLLYPIRFPDHGSEFPLISIMVRISRRPSTAASSSAMASEARTSGSGSSSASSRDSSLSQVISSL